MEYNEIEKITRLVAQAIAEQSPAEVTTGFQVPVGVSARHIHLTQQDVETLFGKGYQLTKKKDLMGGQFASNELVTIVGLKLRAIENVVNERATTFNNVTIRVDPSFTLEMHIDTDEANAAKISTGMKATIVNN